MAIRTFAEGSTLHFALREIHREIRNPTLWIGLLAVGCILGLAGPFGTDAVMRTLPRLAYWICVVALTYASGSFVATLVSETARRRGLPKWPSVAVAGTIAGFVITVELLVLNVAIFGPLGFTQRIFLELLGNVVVISIIVSCAFVAISDQLGTRRPQAVEQNTPQSTLAPLLDRLPFDKRGALVSISVQDHYVDVVTDKGTELLLLRLGDAIAQTAPVAGLQIHRSHWVALDRIASVRRDGPKAIVVMNDGRELPASRTYVPALKDAGLLPR